MGLLVRMITFNFKDRNKLKEKTQLYFLQRLCRLLKDGYPLVDALTIIQWDKQLRSTAKEMKIYLKTGKTIDEACELLQFHQIIVSYLYFVRFSGNLSLHLEKCAALFEQRMNYLSKFMRVIRYPAFLSVAFVVLLLFLKNSILPSFVELFQSTAATSSSILLSITIIDMVSTFILISIVIISFVTVGWFLYRKKVPLDSQLRVYEKIPLLRTALKYHTSFYFSLHLGMFLEASLSLKKTLTHTKKQVKLPIVSYYSGWIMEELSKGTRLESMLLQLSFIDKQLATIFQQRKNNDYLAKDLLAYSEYVTDFIERFVFRLITMIQPIFFSILAVSIIFVYLSIMLPMFQLIKTI